MYIYMYMHIVIFRGQSIRQRMYNAMVSWVTCFEYGKDWNGLEEAIAFGPFGGQSISTSIKEGTTNCSKVLLIQQR